LPVSSVDAGSNRSTCVHWAARGLSSCARSMRG